MSTQRDADHEKLPYEKPDFRTIELVAEEVLAIGCKITGSNGQLGAHCLLPASCPVPGS